ncbi:MAG: ABC transporter ATP-binding protein [Myxococcota bacterium]
MTASFESDHTPPRATIHPDPSKGWFRRLLPLLLAYKGLIAIILPASLLGAATGVAIPWYVARALDLALDKQETPLAPYLWGIAGLAVATGLLGALQMYTMRKLVQSLEYEMRALIYQHLTRLSFSFYDRTQTGQLISRANSDIRATLMFLGMLPMLGMAVLTFFIALGLMVYVHLTLALLAVLTLPGVYFVSARMRSDLFPISWLIQARMADLATIVEENVTGARVVKSFAGEANQIALLSQAAERLRRVNILQVDIRARLAPVLENLPRVGRALVLIYGGWLAIGGAIPVAILLLFNSYIVRLQAPFRLLAFVLIMAQRAAASAVRVFELLDQKPEIVNRPGAVDWKEPRGDVEFRNVTFGYAGSRPVLEGLDLQLRPGETVALVGRTGCGKSTVARLLPRFYDVRDGQVLVDGRDLREYSVESLRQHIGLVLDEPFLFSETIRDNIAYGRPGASLSEVVEAAQVAGAHRFIEGLSEGYDTVVGERGYTLSGGQRQRIAIARTVLVNPKVLILDDATSAIDVQLEQEIHSALRQLMKGRTTLIVAHRLSTIRLADRVALLDGGKVAATGTHEQLMLEVPEYAEILRRAERDFLAAEEQRHEEEPPARIEAPADRGRERGLFPLTDIDIPEAS